MSATAKAAGPVTPQELETVALRLAQAVSTLDIMICGGGAGDMETMTNALGLVMDYLDDCAKDVSDLHRRHSVANEART